MSIYEYDEERQRIWDREEGKEEGEKSGLARGLKASVKVMYNLKMSKEEAVKQLMEVSELSREDIMPLIEKYWK